MRVTRKRGVVTIHVFFHGAHGRSSFYLEKKGKKVESAGVFEREGK